MRNGWNVSEALRYLKENFKPKPNSYAKKAVQTNNARSNSKPLQNGSSSRSKAQNYSDCEDSDEDIRASTDQVYDSEESDTESSSLMTGQRKKVFDFMNKATLMELQTVKSLSEKKASLIMELRPFKDWKDLLKKLESNKALSADLLNMAQELINKQNNVANILEKCNKMVKRLEAAIETGAGIVEQPKILNDE